MRFALRGREADERLGVVDVQPEKADTVSDAQIDMVPLRPGKVALAVAWITRATYPFAADVLRIIGGAVVRIDAAFDAVRFELCVALSDHFAIKLIAAAVTHAREAVDRVEQPGTRQTQCGGTDRRLAQIAVEEMPSRCRIAKEPITESGFELPISKFSEQMHLHRPQCQLDITVDRDHSPVWRWKRDRLGREAIGDPP